MGAARRAALQAENGKLYLTQPAELAAWARGCSILEIGFGMGEHLLSLAERHPRTQILGSDFYLSGVSAALQGLQQRQLRNVRVTNCDALQLLRAYPLALLQVYIYFPDPWPKPRHWRRRLFSAHFLETLQAKCLSGAQLHLATDDPHYAQQMLELLHSSEYWRNATPPAFAPSDSTPTSKFAERAQACGRAVFALSYCKI